MYVNTVRHPDGESLGNVLKEFLSVETFNKAAWIAIQNYPGSRRQVTKLRLQLADARRELEQIRAAYRARAEAEAQLNALMWEGEK